MLPYTYSCYAYCFVCYIRYQINIFCSDGDGFSSTAILRMTTARVSLWWTADSCRYRNRVFAASNIFAGRSSPSTICLNQIRFFRWGNSCRTLTDTHAHISFIIYSFQVETNNYCLRSIIIIIDTSVSFAGVLR